MRNASEPKRPTSKISRKINYVCCLNEDVLRIMFVPDMLSIPSTFKRIPPKTSRQALLERFILRHSRCLPHFTTFIHHNEMIKVINIFISPHHQYSSCLDQLSLFGVLKKDTTGLLPWAS